MHHFPDLLGRLLSTSLFYFKSSWEDIRAAAPMLTGEAALGPPPAPHGAGPDPGPTPAPQGSWRCTWSLSAGHRWTWNSSWRVSPSPGPRPPRRAGPR